MRELIVNLVHHNSSFAVYTSIEVACNSSEWPNIMCRVPTVMVSSVPNFRVLNCSVINSYLPFFIDHSQAIFHDLRLETNTGDYGGGLCIVVDSTVNFNSTFIGYNTAEVSGGGIYTQQSHIVFQNITIKSNTADFGGGLIVYNSTINFNSTSIDYNTAKVVAGGIYSNDSRINFTADSTFIGNSGGQSGGGVYATGNVLMFHNVRVENNKADFGGGLYVFDITISFNGHSSFIGNSACGGGGLNVFSSTINFTADSSFIGNSAGICGGGGVYAHGKSHLVFQNVTVESNTARSYGGGFFVHNSAINFTTDSFFIGNSAQINGGGVDANRHSKLVFQNVRFENNTAEHGGGLIVFNSNITFMGDSIFIGNSAERNGGGGNANDNSLLVFQNVRVENNTANYGSGLIVFNSAINFTADSTFIGNSGKISGGGMDVNLNSLVLFQNVTFENNRAKYGGGLFVFNSIINFEGDSTFIGNSAEIDGGALAADDSLLAFRNVTVEGNTATYYGGGLLVYNNTNVTFDRKTTFIYNSAKYNGGVLYGDNCKIATTGDISLLNNSAGYGGAINLHGCQISLSGSSLFEGNSAKYSSSYGGAIYLVQSDLMLNGSVSFINNTATYGGGLALSADSIMYLFSNGTQVYFERNDANRHGGAIFIQDDPFSYCITDPIANYFRDTCFLQVVHGQYNCLYTTAYEVLPPTVGQDWGIQLVFESNSAKEAGSVLYGGILDRCGFYTSDEELTIGVPFDTMASISDSQSNVSIISSAPFRVCICNESHLDCSQRLTNYNKYPGETFSVPVVAVGQRSGTVPALINTDLAPIEIAIYDPQHIQETNNTCTPLNYTIISRTNNSVASLTLFAEGPCGDQGDPLQIEVSLRSCPKGFALSDEGICTCEERLQKYTTNCDINGRTIEHVGEFWVGYDNHSRGLILHPHCPFDYCKPGMFSFTLANTDRQCDHNRAGDLCGACQPGFSIILGSSQCSRCSNNFLPLIIAFGFAGLALVTLFFICKLTVAEGTFSGLLFYANIIATNQTAFFPPGETNVLTVFTAWLNLDLGIQTCFFDGMDTYSKTWLQFAFPLYIWLLVGIIVIIARYSQLAARIIGNTNPVSVLATLFLLSYTKLLRMMIAVFSLTTLEYPDKTVAVWIHDGNIGYLDTTDAKHISLFLASLLVFLFLFLPYTLVLIFGQCIQARSNHKMLWWANNTRFRSFLDAYHAPYKNSHRYWIGLLLMVRFVLFIISAISDISSPQDPSVNLLVINITTFALSMWVWNTGGMYKKWYLNSLESSFIFNLAVLSATTLYIKLAGGNQAAVVYTSVSIACTTFIGIFCYHMHQRLSETRMWRLVVAPKVKNLRTCTPIKPEAVIIENQHDSIPPSVPTYSTVELRDPLDLITDQ